MVTSATAPQLSPDTAAGWLVLVEERERSGELFLAYDLARQGLERFPDDLMLKHRAVLCLASTGATTKAMEELVRLKLDPLPAISLADSLGLDVATLKPRLLKDAALAASGNERSAALAAAARAYEEVCAATRRAGNKGAYYPGINAATLNLLAGAEAAAVKLAREVLNDLAAWRGSKSFYEIASELEAQLVLGDADQAVETAKLVRQQVRSDPQTDYRGQASMLRQLRLIVEARGLTGELLEVLSPPRVIHYLGHIIAAPGKRGRFPADQEPAVRKAIERLLAADNVGFGYGSLAAGADILFAEALLARGASLHVVLPFDREEFINASVRPSGDGWVERFERCLAAAETSGSVHYATEDQYLGDDHLFSYCSQLAMGLARLRAQHLAAPLEQIVIWDGLPPAGPAGTAADMRLWDRAGGPRKEIRIGSGSVPPLRAPAAAAVGRIERRTRAMLFGDVHGFSGLRDGLLPCFVDVILGCFAAVVERNRSDILFANTWGDGLYLVFDDAGKAAECALQLQEAMGRIDLAANGLPADMGLRIGLHLGPVYAARDPILRRENFFGAQVSRTARVEPVTPEGCVYVTETMAAVLALHNTGQFACQYVGMTKAAKHYGPMRMFLLSRRAANMADKSAD
ncbi:MAG TPA: adenylate/guanylate cyclase domain-containing protein [Stellaceae bacterium]|nr:adenylate/guanylate cyclase domain-containing protein [Stellaceae bacterium]